ncbi:MAG: hypothetical protein M5U12_36160 [Verrucomicrobia bacterium]|nr:hypothetical protein [Verrucomicrobiota bacterium]
MWIGTTADGLHFLQEKRVRVFTTRDGLSGDDVRSVLATREGTLLVGGPSGLDELHGNRTWQRRAARGPEFLGSLRLGWVSALAQDAFGTVWVGLSQHGFDALRYLGGELACPLPLPGLEWMHPTTLAVGPTGRLWIGCNHGITWFEPAGAAPNATTEPAHLAWRTAGVHGRFRVGAHLPDVKLLKLLPAGPEALWAGTAGAGLLYLQGSGCGDSPRPMDCPTTPVCRGGWTRPAPCGWSHAARSHAGKGNSSRCSRVATAFPATCSTT